MSFDKSFVIVVTNNSATELAIHIVICNSLSMQGGSTSYVYHIQTIKLHHHRQNSHF